MLWIMKIKRFIAICRLMIEEGWVAEKVNNAIRLKPPTGWSPDSQKKFCDCPLVGVARREFIQNNDLLGAATLEGEDDFEEAAQQLHIWRHTMKTIIRAADSTVSDNELNHSDRLLRIRILSAFRLGPDLITGQLWDEWRRQHSIKIQHIKLCNEHAVRIDAERLKRRIKRSSHSQVTKRTKRTESSQSKENRKKSQA